MEKMLTLNEDDFEKILKSMIVDVPESVQVPESYRYVTVRRSFLLFYGSNAAFFCLFARAARKILAACPVGL